MPAAFQWDGFVSTSFAHAAAFSSHDGQVEIGVPKGSPALAFGGSIGLSSENEVLLPHGRAFQVASIEERPGGRHKNQNGDEMSGKMPDRFTEPPNIYLGEDRVHDAQEGESELFVEKLKEARRQQTQDRKTRLRTYADELRRKWRL